MKHSSTWFVLILILLASPLSVGRSASAQSLNPQSINRETNNPQHEASEEPNQRDYAGTDAPAINTIHSGGLTDQSSENGRKSHRVSVWAAWVWSLLSVQAFFNFVVTVATVSVAISTYQLVHSNRPYFIFEAERLAGYHPPRNSLTPEEREFIWNTGLLTAQMTLRNAGNGPAIIRDAVGRTIVSSKMKRPFRFSRYRDCYSLYISERFLGTTERTDLVSSDPRELTQTEFEDVRDGKLYIIFYGRVRYRSMLRGRFKARFWYVYAPPTEIVEGVHSEGALLKDARVFRRNT